MRPANFPAFLVMVAVFASVGVADSRVVATGSDELSRQVQIDVVRASLLDISTGKLVIGTSLSVTAKRNAVIEQIALENLKIGGIPIYAAPIRQEFKLRANERLVLPDPLPVSLYFRDLDSVSPLRDAIDRGTVAVDGTAVATVQLSGMGKLLLRSNQIQVPIAFHEEVPFQAPGGALGRTAAQATLNAADSALKSAQGAFSDLRIRMSQFRRDLNQTYGQRALFTRAKYAIRDKQGAVTQMEWTGVALQVAPDQIVVTKEAIEPWKFDPEIAAEVRANRFSVVPGTFDLFIYGQAVLEFGKKDLLVTQMPADAATTILTLAGANNAAKVALQARDNPANLALLQVAMPSGAMDPLPIENPASTGNWDSVAVFRFRPAIGGAAQQQDVILMPATRSGGRIQLAEQVDDAAYGSPIVAPDGVIGIVQDDTGGASWEEVVTSLKLDQRPGAK